MSSVEVEYNRQLKREAKWIEAYERCQYIADTIDLDATVTELEYIASTLSDPVHSRVLESAAFLVGRLVEANKIASSKLYTEELRKELADVHI